MYHGSNKAEDQKLTKASVMSQVGTWSYEVVTEDGKTFCRICVHLRKSAEQFSPQQSSALANRTPSVSMQQTCQDKAITLAELSTSAQTCKDESRNRSAQSQFLMTRSGRQVRCSSHLKDFV